MVNMLCQALRLLLFMVALWSLGAAPALAGRPDNEAIGAYLKAHPEVVLEALAQKKEALYDLVMAGREIKQRQAWRRNIKRGLKNPLKPLLEPRRPRLGNPQAPMLIVEYTDFLCPACRRAAANLEKLLGKHPEKFKLLVKHMPHGDLSRQVALYYESIARQNPAKAWRFYQEVFRRQDELAKKGLSVALEIVKDLELDQARLARDLGDKELAERLKKDAAEGKAFKLGGTPAFVVAGVAVRGPAPVEAFEDVWSFSQGASPAPLAK
jgi:protein-disulfide isomerase